MTRHDRETALLCHQHWKHSVLLAMAQVCFPTSSGSASKRYKRCESRFFSTYSNMVGRLWYVRLSP